MDPIKLDLKDRKILYILSQEARIPPSIIAKQVGLSKDAVKYRIRQLEKKRVIFNYLAEVDVYPLGFIGYDMFMKFNIEPEKERMIAEFFNNHKATIWSCYTSGEWDYYAEMLYSTNEEFHQFTKELTEHFGEELIEYDFMMVGDVYRISQMVESVYDGQGIDLKGVVEPHEFPAGRESRKLDDTEKKLLSVIANNAELPIHVIAERSGLTSEVVRYRLRKLRDEGIIIRTSPVIDYSKIGLEEYIILIDMKNLDDETEKRLQMRIRNNPDAKYAFRALGRLTALILVNTKNILELESFIKELKREFHKIIKSVHFLHVTSQEDYTLFPKILLEQSNYRIRQ